MKELRIAEIRATDPTTDSQGMTLSGVPIVFNVPTVIHDILGDYTEVIRSDALDAADLSDVHLLYNHDLNKVPLARTPKTMSFALNPAGLAMTATLPDTEEGRSVYTAVKRGDLSGMSFAFKVPEGGSLYDEATNTRTITKIDKVYEFSVVPFPAYPQTSIEARGAIKSARIADIERKINLILMRSL